MEHLVFPIKKAGGSLARDYLADFGHRNMRRRRGSAECFNLAIW